MMKRFSLLIMIFSLLGCADCDLIFFENKVNNFDNNDYWENALPLSELILYGYVGYELKEIKGKDLNTTVLIDNVFTGKFMSMTPIEDMDMNLI